MRPKTFTIWCFNPHPSRSPGAEADSDTDMSDADVSTLTRAEMTADMKKSLPMATETPREWTREIPMYGHEKLPMYGHEKSLSMESLTRLR